MVLQPKAFIFLRWVLHICNNDARILIRLRSEGQSSRSDVNLITREYPIYHIHVIIVSLLLVAAKPKEY